MKVTIDGRELDIPASIDSAEDLRRALELPAGAGIAIRIEEPPPVALAEPLAILLPPPDVERAIEDILGPGGDAPPRWRFRGGEQLVTFWPEDLRGAELRMVEGEGVKPMRLEPPPPS